MQKNSLLDVAIIALLGAVVSWLGSSLINPDLLLWGNMNIWFDSDMPRVLQNMTVRTEGHYASFKHPLFALFVWPPTALVQMLTGDALTAARVVLALNAALSVWLVMALLARVGAGRVDRALAALVFVASCAFMFWFSVPETFAFGATSILLALFAASYAAERDGGLVWLVIFGIAGISMTITNFAVFCAALGVGLWLRHPGDGLVGMVRRAILPGAAVLIVAAVLAVVQDRTFGDAGLFFNVGALASETQFIGQDHAAPVAPRPAILVLGAMLYGGAVPSPFTNNLVTGVTEVVKLNVPLYSFTGVVQTVGVALFALALLWGLFGIARARGAGTLGTGAYATALAAGLSLLGFLVLHAVYGAEVFLYVAHMLPLIVVLLGLGLMAANAIALRAVVAALVVVMAVHNGPALIAAHDQVTALNFAADE